VVAVVAALVLGAATGRGADAPAGDATPAAVTTPTALPALANVLTATEGLHAQQRAIDRQLAGTRDLPELEAQISAAEATVQAKVAQLGTPSLRQADFSALVDLANELGAVDRTLTRIVARLTAMATALDDDLGELATTAAQWEQWVQIAAQREAPAVVRERAAAALPVVAEMQAKVRQRRDAVLLALARATRLSVGLGDLNAEIARRRIETREALLAAEQEPIWRIELSGFWARVAVARQQFLGELGQVLNYVRTHAVTLAVLWAALFGGTLTLLRRLRPHAEAQGRFDPRARAALCVIGQPVPAAFVVSLLAFMVLAPQAPLVFYNLVWLLVPVPAVVLARRVLEPPFWRSLYALVVVLSFLPFRAVLEAVPLADRLALIVQCLVLGGVLLRDLVRGRFAEYETLAQWRSVGQGFIWLNVLLLATAVGAAVTGYVGLARFLTGLSLGALGIGLVIRCAFHVVYGVVLAALDTWLAQMSRVVRERPAAVRRFLHRTLVVLGWAVWAGLLLQIMGAFELTPAVVEGVRSAKFEIGWAVVSVSGIVSFVVVLVAVWLLVTLVRFLLEEEILPRLDLGRGVAFAVSTTVRYGLVLGGVLLAVAAAGVDLSRVTLLAGALGVGIGFGLQNVVNNFVSGLIMLFERPVQVGDTIEVGGLMGEVRRIGIRSSTVRTYQGAEVVVPNADLIAKDVINWTMSDRHRRLEIDVGVAYGSEPEGVTTILREVAGAHPSVLPYPEPVVVFSAFGASSLDFRLLAWVRFENSFAVQSDLRRDILRRFAEAGIAIPFPQRDVRVYPAT